MSQSATAESLLAEEALSGLGVSLQSEEAGPKAVRSLFARRLPIAPAGFQRETLASIEITDAQGHPAKFDRTLAAHGCPPLRAKQLDIVQVNLGKLCNMTCRHCHVDAGPNRTDAMMSRATIEHVLDALAASRAHTLDITGGAPELHPHFRYLVERAAGQGKHVIDRCNLTILLVPKFRDLPRWLAERNVEIVASLPHYRQPCADAQRGNGAFTRSIEALQLLNAQGYGQGDPKRILTLMSNPAGAFLGGCQHEMTRDWREHLRRSYGVTFDRLFVLNNIPIARYLDWLLQTGNARAYMQLLIDAFNPGAVAGLMCRNTISVSWDGRLYDCDFNQMLELEARTSDGVVLDMGELNPERYAGRPIRTARHCFGCVAGSGSSCAGATT